MLSVHIRQGYSMVVSKVLWNSTGSLLVYPCHAVIVAMHANNGQQKFFVGHTDKVAALPAVWYSCVSSLTL